MAVALGRVLDSKPTWKCLSEDNLGETEEPIAYGVTTFFHHHAPTEPYWPSFSYLPPP